MHKRYIEWTSQEKTYSSIIWCKIQNHIYAKIYRIPLPMAPPPNHIYWIIHYINLWVFIESTALFSDWYKKRNICMWLWVKCWVFFFRQEFSDNNKRGCRKHNFCLQRLTWYNYRALIAYLFVNVCQIQVHINLWP